MTKKKLFFCFVLGINLVLSSFAQDQSITLPLKEVLNQIEIQHSVKFNYIEEEIVVHQIVPPAANTTIEVKIDYIQSKTKLHFKFVTESLITISNNRKLDKPLCGYLIDGETNQPIYDATVRISGTNSFALTDENGFFQLPLISSNPIEINHISYENKTVLAEEIYIETCPNIVLTPFVQALKEVIGEKYLTSGMRKKKNGTFEIKPKEFGILPGLVEPDVLQTMQQIPGIISSDETVANINVRGGTHDQNLFLWNGIRLFQTGHFFGLISSLNPNLAHTISISKNGSSAFYTESVSSVVDITSRSKSIEQSNTMIGANMINGEFYTNFKATENSSLTIAARRSFTDLISTPTYKNYYNRIFQNTEVIDLANNQDINYSNTEDFYFYDASVQYQQKIDEKNDFFLDLIGISNHLSFTESTLSTDEPLSKNSELAQQTFGGNLTWKTAWSVKNYSEISLSGSYYFLDAYNQSVTNNQILVQENSILDTGIKLKNSHQLSEKFTLLDGYQFNEIGIRSYDNINTPLYSRTVKEVLRSHALITEIQYESKNNKLFSKFGLRGNYFEKWKMILIEPRFQLNYALTNFLSVELLGEIKNQTTSQIIDLQQDFLGIEKRRWILANNESIPIQKSMQASCGFIVKQNNWLLNLEGFYKEVNGITSSGQGFQNQLEFVKIIGEYKIYGVEFLIQKQIQNFTAWLNYTWNHNDYTFEGYIPPQFANNFELAHSVALATTYEWRNFKLALGSKWFTGRPTTIPLSDTPIYNTPDNPEIEYSLPNSTNLEDYFQLNFSTAYTFLVSKKVKLQLGFSVQNVLDNKNIINQFYRINQNNNGIEEVNTYSLERTPNAFLKFSF